MKEDSYPAWVCAECAHAAGKTLRGLATFHPDACGICGKAAIVTEPRDYGHFTPPELRQARTAAQQRQGGG